MEDSKIQIGTWNERTELLERAVRITGIEDTEVREGDPAVLVLTEGQVKILSECPKGYK